MFVMRALRQTMGLVAGCAAGALLQVDVLGAQLAASIDSVATRMFALNAAPGVSVVVVRDTQIVYARGFGYADLEAKRPVTAETEFYVASVTKSFTGLAVAMLDLEGTIELDAPISRYLPGLPLRRPLNAGSITVRSLLAHTHGIGDGPVELRLAYTGEYRDNGELIRLLAEHEPNPRGREFTYSNLGYNIVGFAIDTTLRESWKSILARLIFRPLGMTRTSATVSNRSRHHLAMPYVSTANGFARTPFVKTDATMQSAGGLITTALDMGRWLEAQINGGRLDGRQILPAAAVAETHRIQARVQGSTRGTRSLGYGLGWRIGLLGSDTLLAHNGGFIGFATHMSFMPEHRIGVAVMANEGQLGASFTDMMAYAIYDVLRGRPGSSPDSLAALQRQVQRARARIAATRLRSESRPQRLRHPVTAYAGRYFSPVMGHLELQVANGRLEARMGAARSAVDLFDRRKNQLRLELFGSPVVATVEMRGGRAQAITMSKLTYRRVP